MPFIPKTPDSCRDLDLVHVSRTLAKHYGYIPTAARELGILPKDLRRLTWAKPHILDEAHEGMELVVISAWGGADQSCLQRRSAATDVGERPDSFELDGAE
jgi:hypothetical protein